MRATLRGSPTSCSAAAESNQISPGSIRPRLVGRARSKRAQVTGLPSPAAPATTCVVLGSARRSTSDTVTKGMAQLVLFTTRIRANHTRWGADFAGAARNIEYWRLAAVHSSFDKHL